jgi:hypothetical protein
MEKILVRRNKFSDLVMSNKISPFFSFDRARLEHLRLVWQMKDSSGWKRIGGDFGKF